MKDHYNQAGLKAIRSFYLGGNTSWVFIKKCETEILKKGSTSPSTLAWVSTVHKVQGLTLEQGVIDFHQRKQNLFGPWQIRNALSMVKTSDNLCCVGKKKKSLLRVNKDALLECKCLKQK